MPDYTFYVYTRSMFTTPLPAEATNGNSAVIPTIAQPLTLTLRPTATPTTITVRDTDVNGTTIIGGQPWLTSDSAFNEVTTRQIIVDGGGAFQAGQRIHGAYTLTGTDSSGQPVLFEAFQVTATGDGRNTGQVNGVMSTVELVPGQSYTFTASITSASTPLPYSSIACFTAGSLIATPGGETPIEALRPGDLVLTVDRGAAPIRWVGWRRLSASELAQDDRLRPVRIAAGALGDGLPTRDLVVSQQHRILLRSPVVRRLCGADEVLVAAKRLLGLPGVALEGGEVGATYLHLLLDRHEVVLAEGAAAETLFVGEQALRSLGEEGRAEVFAIFPELKRAQEPPVPARPLATGRTAREIARRHARNGRPLCAAAL